MPPLEQQVDGIIKRQIGAALNRGVIEDVGAWCTVGDFYRVAPTNLYSKILHDCYEGGACYGFSYDDVCNQYSSTVSLLAATDMTVTVPDTATDSRSARGAARGTRARRCRRDRK